MPCDNQASSASVNNPHANILEFLPCIPFELSTLLEGKATRSLISEITRISLSRLRRGKSFTFRESTANRAIRSAIDWSRNRVIDKGWGEEEWNLLVESAPSSIAGEPRPFADFIHGLKVPGAYEFPQATAFAEEIDLAAIKLLDSYKSDDLESFKRSVLDCAWLEVVASQQEISEQMATLRTATDWDAALPVAQQFIFDMLLCYFAALDAEFGLKYFTRFKLRPLFLLVIPKLNATVDSGSIGNVPKRNLIHQPIRRLLELSHALMVWGKDQRWPSKSVGRKELGVALGLDDQHIGNYFDGTRNMYATSFVSYWEKMCRTVAECEPFPAPIPLLLAAIFWQRTIAHYPNDKLKSFVLPDKETYTRFWLWHHQRWGSQLDREAVGWPTWLDD